MTTIDKLDISVNNMYAIRITMIEQINSQLRLNEAASIPAQLTLVDIYPRLSELDLLLGVVPHQTPWAYFFPPKNFTLLRRNPFAFHRIVPTFGHKPDQYDDEEKLDDMEIEDEEEEKERGIIRKCLKRINKINDMMGYIVGRVGQFLQG